MIRSRKDWPVRRSNDDVDDTLGNTHCCQQCVECLTYIDLTSQRPLSFCTSACSQSSAIGHDWRTPYHRVGIWWYVADRWTKFRRHQPGIEVFTTKLNQFRSTEEEGIIGQGKLYVCVIDFIKMLEEWVKVKITYAPSSMPYLGDVNEVYLKSCSHHKSANDFAMRTSNLLSWRFHNITVCLHFDVQLLSLPKLLFRPLWSRWNIGSSL